MSIKPILFNTEMVRAILDGRKTQTRRVIKSKTVRASPFTPSGLEDRHGAEIKAKYEVDDTLWVREPSRVVENNYLTFDAQYLADKEFMWGLAVPERFISDNGDFPKWLTKCQGIPNGCIKEMARIFLKVTDVRVERLQDISHDDVYAEGFPIDYYEKGGENFRHWWIDLWNSTSKDGYKWEDNPYVFVYEFERVEK